MKFVAINVSGDLCARLLPGTEYLEAELNLAHWVINGERMPQDAWDGYYIAEYFPGGKYLGPDADGVEPVFSLTSAETEADVHGMIKMLEGYGERFSGNIPTDTAHDWLDHDFTADSAAEWCEIGVWDPATAADLSGADLLPCEVAKLAQWWAPRDVIYEACNGDFDAQELINAVVGPEPVRTEDYDLKANSMLKVWDACDSQILYVVDERGVNFASARVRHLLGDQWLYVDDTDGFEVVNDEVVESWTLLAEDPRLGYDSAGNVVRM